MTADGRVRRVVRRCLPALAGLLMTAAAAEAQGLGVRAGASVDPDQFYFGGHFETAPLADNLRFRPNVEIGVGNDVTVAALNFEFAYHFDAQSPWHIYAGAGPALNVFNVDSDTSSEGGFNILVGVQHQGGLFFEVKAGMLDSPDFKVGVGYVFRP
jgi:hypothetical protein